MSKEDIRKYLKINKKTDQLSFLSAVELLRMHEFNREVNITHTRYTPTLHTYTPTPTCTCTPPPTNTHAQTHRHNYVYIHTHAHMYVHALLIKQNKEELCNHTVTFDMGQRILKIQFDHIMMLLLSNNMKGNSI